MKKKLLALLVSATMILSPGTGLTVIASDATGDIITETSVEEDSSLSASASDIADSTTDDGGSDHAVTEQEGENSGEESVDPSQGESTGPSEGESTDPSQGENTDPSQGESIDPSQGESTDPSQGENTDPSQGETVDPSQGDVTDPVDDGTGENSGEEVTDPTETPEDPSADVTDDGTDIATEDPAEAVEETTEETAEEETDLEAQAVELADANVKEGYYQITCVGNTDIAISIPGATISDAKLKAGEVSDNVASTFKIIPLGEGLYEILGFASNKALTAPAEAEGAVTQADYTGSDKQQWYILKSQDDKCVYICSKTDKNYSIRVNARQVENGKAIALRTRQDKAVYTQWTLKSVGSPALKFSSRYVFRSAAGSNYAMETEQGKTNAGANVQVGAYGPYNRQSYVLESVGYGNIYKIKNDGTGFYLSVYEDNIEQDMEGTDFRMVKVADGYSIVDVASGKYLDIEGGKAKKGANIILAPKSGALTQVWTAKVNKAAVGKDVSGEDAGLANGYYMISLSDNTKQRMAVKNAGIGENDNIQIDESYPTDCEQWYIESLGDGLYKIKAFCSDKVLTAAYKTVEKKMNVSQMKYTGAYNQRWYIRKSSVKDGTYVICSADDPNYVVGTYGTGVAQGSNVRMYVSNKNAHQNWVIKKISSPRKNALANGTYYFTSRLTYKRDLFVKDNSKSSGANVELSLKRDSKGEWWTVKYLGYGNIYKITNKNSGLSLAAKNDSSGANVLQKKYDSSDETMMWRILPYVSGSNVYYRIVNVSNNQGIQVKGNNKKSGTNVLLAAQSSAKGQLWEPEKATKSPAKYTNICLYPVEDNDLYVSMITGNSANGKRFVINKASKTELTKTFYIAPVARDVYSIKSVATGKYLSVNDSKKSNNASIVQDSWRDLDSQKWKIEKYGSGYRFINVNSGKYLTVKNGDYSSGTYMVQQSARTDNAQTFNWTTSKPVTNGWTDINEHRGYVKNGVIQTDKFISDGQWYVDKNGYNYTGWKKYGKYYFYYNGSEGKVNDTRPYLSDLFGTKTSKYSGYTCPDCEYYIVVDVSYPCMATVYTSYPGTSDHNLPVFAWLVSPGTTETPTDPGSRRTGGNQRWKSLMGPSWGQYSTEALLYTYPPGTSGEAGLTWVCNGEYFHSVACTEDNTYNLNPGTYNLLGTRQSHGCIRCPVRYSYWVYEYVTYGSGMYVGSDCARPLVHVPIPYAIGRIDPTDPNYTGNWGYTDSKNYVGGYWSGYINR